MIKYYIDRTDLQSLGINVSKSQGLFNLPKLRDTLKTTWPNRHGEIIELSEPIYDVREIELDCYMKAPSRLDFLVNLNNIIYTRFYKPQLRELKIELITGKPLLYYCYMPNGINMELATKWNTETHIGKFKLNLIEPEPFKRVFAFNANVQNSRQITLQYDPSPQFTVYWGDGSYNVITSGTQINHQYQTDGTYYIALVGMIDHINNLVTLPETELIWNLQ